MEDRTIEIYEYNELQWQEGRTYEPTDFVGVKYTTINSLEYNKTYSGTGTLNSQCSVIVDENGHLTTTIIIPNDTVVYNEKSVSIADGAISVAFSDDGKTMQFNSMTYILEE